MAFHLLAAGKQLSPTTHHQREVLLTVAAICMASAAWLIGTTTLGDRARLRALTLRPPAGADAVSDRLLPNEHLPNSGVSGPDPASSQLIGPSRPAVSWSAIRRVGVGVAAGLGPVVLFPGPVGLLTGTAVGVVAVRVLAYRPARDEQRQRELLAADLPLALDLIAACLTAGAPIVTALDIVAEAVAGPLGAELGIVSRGLRLGASPAEACRRLLDPGRRTRPGPSRWAGAGPAMLASGSRPAPGSNEIAAFARALHRTEDSGARLAMTLERLADQTRVRQQEHALAAARRAGVAAVAPLGLCFLPAFISLGVVPVVIGAGSGLAIL